MKRGQFWYADFMIAVVILMVIGLLFATSIIDITSRNEVIKELILEASDISTSLMSEGYGTQEDWKNGIGTVGFVTNYHFDRDKFYNFLGLDYDIQKFMLGTIKNVWIYLADKDGIIIESNKAKAGVTSLNEIDADNLVHIKRFVFCNEDIELCGEDEDGKGDIFILGVVVWN